MHKSSFQSGERRPFYVFFAVAQSGESNYFAMREEQVPRQRSSFFAKVVWKLALYSLVDSGGRYRVCSIVFLWCDFEVRSVRVV